MAIFFRDLIPYTAPESRQDEGYCGCKYLSPFVAAGAGPLHQKSLHCTAPQAFAGAVVGVEVRPRAISREILQVRAMKLKSKSSD